MGQIKKIGLALFGAAVILGSNSGEAVHAKTILTSSLSEKPVVTLIKFKKHHHVKKHHAFLGLRHQN